MSENKDDPKSETIKSKTGYGEYDTETVERVHQDNIRKAKEAAAHSASYASSCKAPKQYTWKGPPRKVGDHEISPYQGRGGEKQKQRAQSRKRRQVRRREASIWDDLAPKEVHGILNFMLLVIFALGLVLAFTLSGAL